MSLITEPIPFEENDPNVEFLYLNQLQRIVSAANFLSLTSRDGAIQQGDKAGNLNAVWVVFTSNGTANTEDTVPHTLGRVPFGFLASCPDKAAVIYNGTTAWTTSNIYVKTSVATVAWKLLVF